VFAEPLLMSSAPEGLQRRGEAGAPDADAAAPSRLLVDYIFNDHAGLRLLFQNAHRVSDELVRSNQPWPHQLRRWKARGVRTIINLRGEGAGAAYHLERQACAELGLHLVNFPVTAKAAPPAAQVRAAADLFDAIAYPALMHCKSGADRTSLMSALYLHFRRNLPVRAAVRQLSVRYLHLNSGPPGVLDEFFRLYLQDEEPAGVSLLEWVESARYDPDEITASYRRNRRRGASIRWRGNYE
jgi:protein tyrosine/serine phosphatase